MLLVQLLLLLGSRQPAPLVVRPYQLGHRSAEELAEALHALHLLVADDGQRVLPDGLYGQVVSVELVEALLLDLDLPAQEGLDDELVAGVDGDHLETQAAVPVVGHHGGLDLHCVGFLIYGHWIAG